MSVNEFEKQVQQTMSGWKLPPGENVWTEVEKRIREEKRRRGLFILFFSLFLLLGGGITAIVLLNQHKNKQQHLTESGIVTNKNTNNRQPDLISTDPKEKTLESQPIKNEIEEPRKATVNENKTGQPVTIKQPDKPVVDIESQLQNAVKKNKTADIHKPIATNEDSRNEIVKQKDAENTQTNVIAPLKNADKKEIQNTDIPVTQKQVVADTAVNSTKAETKTPETINPAVDPDKKQDEKNKKAGKLSWSLSAQVGSSSYVEGLSLFSGRKSFFDQLQSPSGPPQASPVRPRYKPGLSVGVMVVAKQSLSPKLSLQYSAGYAFLSTRQTVGNRVNSFAVVNGQTIGSYYLADAKSSFTNKFHLFDLSAELSWKVINKNKFKLYWNNGVGYNWLFASDVLHYNSGLQGYYKNPDKLTRHHVFLSTGLSFPVSKKISIDPFASYSLTRINRLENDTMRAHFSNYGLRLRIALGNKNK